ncbi:ML domain-containing protein [Mucor mucedo]|uniref:ML domain-containing protein n=1 Tax=Mucor mucedo TaxID=29922 RepID=UPI00221F91D7|nr:ML domain-containing protein [Mucor mucedo]KAI7893821.1 ML domain-containing protein [Mucor mucedo]
MLLITQLLILVILFHVNHVSSGMIYWYAKEYSSDVQQFSNFHTEGNVNNCGQIGDILDIVSIRYSPSVLTVGSSFMLDASGELFEELFDGAYVQVVLKYDRTIMVSRSDNICQQLERKDGNNIKCTIKKGVIKVSQKFNIPKTTPPGRYDLTLIGYNGDGSPIGCLNANVLINP